MQYYYYYYYYRFSKRWLTFVVGLLLIILLFIGNVQLVDFRVAVVTEKNDNDDSDNLRFYESSDDHSQEKGKDLSSSSFSKLVDLQATFPECFFSSEELSLNTTSMGKYVAVNKTIDPPPPRYTHMCFLMKSRYNCAHAITSKKKNAFDFKLLLLLQQQQPQQQIKDADEHAPRNKFCDMQRLVDTAGGPTGIAQRVLPFLPANKKNNNNNNTTNKIKKKNKKFKMLFYGNSYLRQIFEALVCGFEDQITDLKVQVGGPSISMKDLKKRRQKGGSSLIRKEELNQTTIYIGYDEARKGGCHSGNSADISEFYRPNVTVPPNIENCDDNFGMVEFGNVFRVYYIFRPTYYERDALEYAMKQIGYYDDDDDDDGGGGGPQKQQQQQQHKQHKQQQRSNTTSTSTTTTTLDLIVSNIEVDDEMFPFVDDKLTTTTTTTMNHHYHYLHHYKFDNLLETIKQIQRNSLLDNNNHKNKYFGADNPWISHPPNNHPCMPGIPDDEANYLFLKILNDFVFINNDNNDNKK